MAAPDNFSNQGTARAVTQVTSARGHSWQAQAYIGFWGRAPSGVQGQRPWPGFFDICKASFNTRVKLHSMLEPGSMNNETKKNNSTLLTMPRVLVNDVQQQPQT